MTLLPALSCVLLLLRLVLASLPAPVNVTLSSNNFLHVLRWEPGPGTPPGTKYWIHNSNRKNDKEVSSTSCQLKLNYDLKHHLSVSASYNGTRSPPSVVVSIWPIEDTVLGPPSLALTRSSNKIQIHLSLPDADRHTGMDVMAHYSAYFRVAWREGSRERKLWKTKDRNLPLWALEEGQHCFRVSVETVLNSNTPWSDWSCVTTRGAEHSAVAITHVLFPVLVLIIVALTLLTFILCYTGHLGRRAVLLDMLSQMKPSQIHKTILKPDWTPVDIPDCHLAPGSQDPEVWSNTYIHRRVQTCSDTTSSSCLMVDSAQNSAQDLARHSVQESARDSSGLVESECSGLQNQTNPEGGEVGEHSSSEEEEEEVQSEEDCVDLFSVTITSLSEWPQSWTTQG